MPEWFVCEVCEGHIDSKSDDLVIVNKEETHKELWKYAHVDCNAKPDNMADIQEGKKYWNERFGAKF
jgi:hypothetical protein